MIRKRDKSKSSRVTHYSHFEERIKIQQSLQPKTQGSKQRAKTIVLARHGMLDCGGNNRGVTPTICRSCSTMDDENHRLSLYRLYSEFDLSDKVSKVNFDDIFSYLIIIEFFFSSL